MTKKQLAVIFGGRSGEHEVSLMSARSMLSVIDRQKYEVTQIGVTPAGRWLSGKDVIDAFEHAKYDGLTPLVLPPEPRDGQLYRMNGAELQPLVKLDVVFPLIHGTFGEDGTLQGLLELANLAYVGCGVLASAVGMDKSLFKDVMRANHLPVAESMLFNRELVSNQVQTVIESIESKLPYPVFVKPANLGSSVRITRCTSRSSLLEGLLEAVRFDRRVLVERGIDAIECEVSVLGNENPIASVPGEIRPAEDFYTYSAKYLSGKSELLIPAQLDDSTRQTLSEMAVHAFQAIDGAGMARVDFLIERATGIPYISEVNTIPGFTSISMYAKLWEAAGISYPELVDRLIDLAFQRKQQRDHTEHTYRRDE